MKLELRPHPARQRSSITKAFLRDDNGEYVPLLPHQRAIHLEGRRVGYCHDSPGKPISLIVRLSQYERDKIREFVEKETGGPAKALFQPPSEEALRRYDRKHGEEEVDDDDD